MRALYNKNGTVVAWLSNSDEWIVDAQGRPIGIIREGTIYDALGHAAGWWNHQQVHDLSGRIVLLLRDAPHLGVPRPAFRTPPTPPIIRPTSAMPAVSAKPFRRIEKREWGNGLAFL